MPEYHVNAWEGSTNRYSGTYRTHSLRDAMKRGALLARETAGANYYVQVTRETDRVDNDIIARWYKGRRVTI
jgi:hypothetical protein